MDNKLILFTDGACIGNGTKYARGGIGVYFPNEEFENISERFTIRPITNQRTELWAIYRALVTILPNIDNFSSITIYTDSQYSIKSLTVWIKKWKRNNWQTTHGRPVENKQIIVSIHNILSEHDIKFKHVMSHTEQQDPISLGNKEADQLAKKAIRSFSKSHKGGSEKKTYLKSKSKKRRSQSRSQKSKSQSKSKSRSQSKSKSRSQSKSKSRSKSKSKSRSKSRSPSRSQKSKSQSKFLKSKSIKGLKRRSKKLII